MRIRLGDIVPMYIPPGESFDPPLPYPQVPALPLDIAGNFVTSTFVPQTTVPATAGDEAAAPYEAAVTGGPFFVGSQPNLPAPFSNPGYAPAYALRHPYQRTAMLQDSQLPFALQRVSRLQQSALALFTPTEWDVRILKESALWRFIAEHGGLKSCCRIPELGAPVWSIPPWLERPSNGLDFQNLYFQPLSAFISGGAFTGLDVQLGTFRVPLGWNGVIKKVVFGFTGDGHQEGSGDIVWRLQVGERYARNFGNVLNSYGSLETALLIQDQHIDIISGQNITLIGNVPATSTISSGEIFAGVFGWFWPVR